MAEENKLQVFPVGITEKEIKKIADEAIAEAGGTGGTEVVANPVLEGGEADLESIGIAGTNYKIATGGGSGSFEYEEIDISSQTATLADLYAALGANTDMKPVKIAYFKAGSTIYFYGFITMFDPHYGGNYRIGLIGTYGANQDMACGNATIVGTTAFSDCITSNSFKVSHPE